MIRATRFSDGKGFILVYDTGVQKGGRITNISLPAGQTGIGHDYTRSGGNVSAVTVLALRASDTRPRLYVFDAITGDRLWVRGLNASWAPIAVRAFQTAGGAWRVAALTQRGSDERPIVAIYNANTGALIDNVLFQAGQTAVDLTIFPDTTLDTAKQPELGVTMEIVAPLHHGVA